VEKVIWFDESNFELAKNSKTVDYPSFIDSKEMKNIK